MREETYITINDELQLKVITFPSEGNKFVFFFPGWIVDLNNFMPIISPLQKVGYTVRYVETREKKSSIFTRKVKKHDFLLDLYVDDLEKILEYYDHEKFYFLCTSMGAHIILRYMTRNKKRQAESSIILIPAMEIKFVGWQKLLIRLPLFLDKVIIALVEWYLRRQFVNPKEPETAYKFSEKLYEIDFYKIKMCAQAINMAGGIQLHQYAQKVENKLLLIGAENDLMHPEQEIIEFSEQLPYGEYLGLYSNKYTHGDLMGRIAVKYFNKEDYRNILKEIVKI